MSEHTAHSETSNGKTITEKDVIDAFMAVVVERGADQVVPYLIAEKLGINLAELRQYMETPFEVIEKFERMVDDQVLANIPPELMEDAPRERIFDVMMMRFDFYMPYKGALEELFSSARRNPLAMAAWAEVATKSQYWMLTGAGATPKGPAGMLRARAVLFTVWGPTFQTWLKDDDPGMAKTMAELDKRLRNAHRNMKRLKGATRFSNPLGMLAGGLARGLRGAMRNAARGAFAGGFGSGGDKRYPTAGDRSDDGMDEYDETGYRDGHTTH